jgi:L-methionine (R)-S-oxide reductase
VRPTLDYALLERQLRELLDVESDFIANAGNFAAFVFYEIPDVNWAGFYLAMPSGDLVLGPFAGRPACTLLAPGRGVCGAAVSRGATVVVDDVNAFADHIVCDAASRSEIVVPLVAGGVLYGVFDCDSPLFGRFSDTDRDGIERLIRLFTGSVRAPLPPAR